MKANYGATAKYEYPTIAGYLIRAGLVDGKIAQRFSVYILLHSQIDSSLEDLPSQNPKLNNGWEEDLKITYGTQLLYTFPNISFQSIESFYTNSLQYHLLQFTYTGQAPLTPGQGKNAEIPGIQISNTRPPTYLANMIRSKGSLALNRNGANPAPLLGLQAKQETQRSSGIQMITERCCHDGRLQVDTGWLNKLLDLNKHCNEGKDIDLVFSLNGKVYDCAPKSDNPRADIIYFEERWGLTLDFLLSSVEAIDERMMTEWKPIRLQQMIPRISATEVIEQTIKAGAIRGAGKSAVEICSVIANNNLVASQFDWRTPLQKPAAPEPT